MSKFKIGQTWILVKECPSSKLVITIDELRIQGDNIYFKAKELDKEYNTSLLEDKYLLQGSIVKLCRPAIACLEETKIKFTVEESYLEGGFGIGFYAVPVSKIPDFIKSLKPNEVITDSEEM